jgi:hypothetical protein
LGPPKYAGEFIVERTLTSTEGHSQLLVEKFVAAVTALLSLISSVAWSATTIANPSGTVQGLGKKGLQQWAIDQGVGKVVLGCITKTGIGAE